jgi:FecR protein
MILSAGKRPAIALIAFLISMPAASADPNYGCAIKQIAGTTRHILRCPNGVTIQVEAQTIYKLFDRDKDGNADAVGLRGKALLLELPPGGSGFQVITPQAIAAVRGTKWAVDVQGGKTSVFVERGRVAVGRMAATKGVSLGPGEGVDVDAGEGPLTVKRWKAKRVSALMARFGQ